MSNTFEFSRHFDEKSFEKFSCDYCNLKLNEEVFYLTKKGKDDKIDLYTKESVAIDSGLLTCHTIVQVKFFESNYKDLYSRCSAKIRDTLMIKVDGQKEYSYRDYCPKVIIFVFSEALSQDNKKKLTREITKILAGLKLGENIPEDVKIYDKEVIIQDIIREPKRYSSLGATYNLPMLMVDENFLKENTVPLKSKNINLTSSNTVAKVVEDIFKDLSRKIIDSKSILFYNSHVIFLNYNNYVLERRFTSDRLMEIKEDIHDEVYRNFIEESGIHENIVKFFNTTINRRVLSLELHPHVHEKFHTQIRHGLYVNSSLDEGRIILSDKLDWNLYGNE